MTTIRRALLLFFLCVGAVVASAPAQNGAQQVVVPLTEPGRPATLESSLIQGSIRVEGYDGDQIIVDATPRKMQKEPERVDGMLKIPNSSMGLTIEEKDNAVSVSADWMSQAISLVIRVPRQTSLSLSCVNNCELEVEGVSGDLELSNVNGSIRALQVRGSVVANTTNGEVVVELLEVTRDKPMSLTTWNGTVDLSVPADFSADLRMSAGRGDIYSDFDVEIDPTPVEVKRDDNRGYRVRLEREVKAKVGGGGAEVHLKTSNGKVYLRRIGG